MKIKRHKLSKKAGGAEVFAAENQVSSGIAAEQKKENNLHLAGFGDDSSRISNFQRGY